MNHLFIALGQNHLDNFETLIFNNVLDKGNYILIIGTNVKYDAQLWDIVHISKASFDNRATTKLSQLWTMQTKISAYKALIKELKIYALKPHRAYLCYIEDVLSNYLFFSFSEKTKVIVVEDGMLNYYNHTIATVSRFKFKMKQILSRLNGVPFKEYKGHSSGAVYPHVINQYLTFPDQAIIKNNAKQLPIKTQKLINIKPALYIIGQEVWANVLGVQAFETLLSNYFRTLQKQPFYDNLSTIYYKPHRNGMRISKESIQAHFPEKHVEMIISDKTSENVYFEELSCGHISSFNSSTLINIFARLNEENRDVVKMLVYTIPNIQPLPIFKKLGFTLLND